MVSTNVFSVLAAVLLVHRIGGTVISI